MAAARFRSAKYLDEAARHARRVLKCGGASRPAAVSLAACVIGGFPALKPGFWSWCLAFGVCQTLSTIALSKALKLSEISLVTALWKVSLLILLGLAWVTIGERPSALGIGGVLLSAVGVYLLNIRRARVSPWAPLAVLVTDRGQRYTLLAALLYAPSVITIKQAILASNAAMGTFGGYLVASAMVSVLALRTSARHFSRGATPLEEFVAWTLAAHDDPPGMPTHSRVVVLRR